MRRFCIASAFLSILCPSRLLVFRARHGTAEVCPLSRRVSVRVHRWRKDGWWKMYRWVWVFNSQSFITMETTTLNLCFCLFNYQKSKSGFFFCTWFVYVCKWEWQIGFLCLFFLSDESLQEFSLFLKNLEDQRELMVRTASQNLHEYPGKCLWVCVSLPLWPSICLCLWMG